MCAMKSKAILFKVSDEEKATIQKAAVGHKSTTAFLLFAARFMWKHRKLVEQIQKLDLEYYARNLKTPPLFVAIQGKEK